jgi:hypothetical protein
VRTTHRLDLLLLPEHIDQDVDPVAFAFIADGWIGGGLLAHRPGGLGPGPAANALLPGGFAALRLDRPGATTLYANEQGGFRAPCPRCGAPLAGPLSAAVEAWRRGGPRALTCPRCGWAGDLSAIQGQPPFGIARAAVIFADVGGVELSSLGQEALAALLGAARVVLRRPS